MAITLKAARVNKILTQEQAAELLGTTAAVIGNWERGISFPKIPMIKKIEEVYGLPYSEIIFLPNGNG